MELSLDDIIRKQRRTRVRKGGPPQSQPKNVHQIRSGPKVTKKPNDARNRIILKKRTQITDARDKLAEIAKKKDARLKLDQLRMNRGSKVGAINRSPFGNIAIQKNRNGTLNIRTKGQINRGIFSDLTRQVHPSPIGLSPRYSRNTHMSPVLPISGYGMDISMDEEYVPAPLKPIIRMVNNDVPHFLPPPPSFPALSRIRNQQPLRDKPLIGDMRTSLNFKIVAKNNDVRVSSISSSGILNRIHEPDDAIYIRDTSPTSPVSILKKRPFGGKSVSNSLAKYDSAPISHSRAMASHRTQRPMSPPQSSGFRIVVSNLQNSVTASDIHELFGDIGKLVESKLVRTGTAEVIYSSLQDAQKAVDVYHNRQLDGQPMKCFLVSPRNPTSSARNKPNLPASSNSSVIPDISTFHKVLFRKN
ncbi:uncharacterized protein LOC143921376 isoform X2 [Arctopsyche grandis]|uniref:uncharacterized protein LOC143921376 isoform X2 n=1 Tax=Arctopsyche grandis TaxID=121162 RepID=UPI00406D8773